MSTESLANAGPTAGIRFPWRWILVGVLAYFIFLLATFPAARLVPRLQPLGILAAGVTGTVWNGDAAAVQTNGIILGPTHWEINIWRLFTGALSVDVEAKRDDGYLSATVRKRFFGAISLHDVRGNLPMNALASLGLPGGTNGWAGTLQVQLNEVTIADRWPTAIYGSVLISDLVGPPQQPTALGTYRIVFGDEKTGAGSKSINGTVASSDDAPLDVKGTIRLDPNRNYVIDAQVATRASAPANIVKALQYLGPPDASGHRPLSFAGSL